MFDKVLNGAVILPPATSAIGLPSLAAWAASLPSSREDDVDRAFDRLLEILAADFQRAARRHAVGDHDDLGLRRVGLEPGEDADRVARRGQRQLARRPRRHARRGRGADIGSACGAAGRARSIRTRCAFLPAVGRRRVPSVISGCVDRRFRRQHRQPLVGANHGAFDEQAVDAARIFDRVGQAAAGLEVERQRAGPEMHVEIEQSGRCDAPFRRAARRARSPGSRPRRRRERRSQPP